MTGSGAVALVVADGPPGAEVAEGLGELGHAVAVIGPPDAHQRPATDPCVTVPCDFGSAGSVDVAVRAALEALAAGPPRLLVWARFSAGSGDGTALADLSEDDWERLAERPITDFLHCLQGASPHLHAGAAVVLVVPSVVLAGAAGAVAWTAAAEGQRSLLRAAARRWGERGVTLDCVAAPTHLLCGRSEALDRPGLPPPSLPAEPTLGGSVARTVSRLAAMSDVVTGATLSVDGGVWMTP